LVYELEKLKNKRVTIILRDLFGQEIQMFEYSNLDQIRNVIDLSNYSQGLYFIDVSLENGQRKIVKFLIN
jgi:hypothetical protein